MVECEWEKLGNEHLKKGLDIFEDYCCDKIDEGLKTITSQIDQFIRNDNDRLLMLSANRYWYFRGLPLLLIPESFWSVPREDWLDHLFFNFSLFWAIKITPLKIRISQYALSNISVGWVSLLFYFSLLLTFNHFTGHLLFVYLVKFFLFRQ